MVSGTRVGHCFSQPAANSSGGGAAITDPKIEPTRATLGATVRGVKLGALDASAWGAIEAAFHRYALLIFPDQHPSSGDQVAFARRFARCGRSTR